MFNKQKFHFINSRKWTILIVLFLFMLIHPSAYAQDKQVRIGVLALRGAEEASSRWKPTAEYLSRQIPGYSFAIVPLNFEEIYGHVERGEVDFVLENSSIYVELEYLYGIDRIATMNALWEGQSLDKFGGIIFINKNQEGINNIDDLKNKSFIAVNETSFGGWRMTQREIQGQGIDPYKDFTSLQFGNTHDNVVYAIQKGQVDAGTVRTGILESMHKEGKIDIEDFTILNQQHYADFPLLVSTRLYPEWPFARVKHTSKELSEQVSIALLSVPINNYAAKAAGIAGWTIPQNYQLVHECLKDLQVSPYEYLGEITFTSFIKQYGIWFLLMFIIIGIVLAWNKFLRKEIALRKKAEIDLKRSGQQLEFKVKERTSALDASIKELKKSEHKFRIFIDFTHDWEYWIDNNLDFKYVSASCKQITGYTPEEFYEDKKLYRKIIHPDDRERVCNHQKNFKTSKEQSSLEFRVITRGKKEIWIEHYCRSIFDDKGKNIGKRGSNRDITERKEMAKKLRASQEILKKEKEFTDNAINAQVDTFFVFNPKTGKAIRWNKAFKDVSGYSDKEISKLKAPDSYYDKEDLKKTSLVMSRVFKGESVLAELNFITKSGKKIPYEYRPSLLEDEKDNLIVSIGRDIVERKAQQEKIDALDILKTKFIEVVSHQLRTPLSGIKWTLETLLGGKLKEDQITLVKKAYEADELIIDRIDELLIVLDIQEGRSILKKEDASIENLWLSVMSTYKEALNIKSIKLKYIPSKTTLALINIDAEKIRVVFNQFMRNAIDYSKKNSQINAKLELKNNKIRFELKDTGVGIPEAEQVRIFSMFYRATNASTMVPNQSGVGLVISQHYIKEHGGKIGFKSKEGQGSTFWFELPIK